jgi:type II secretory pathway component PulK
MRNTDSGQAIVMALLALTVAVLLVVGFIYFASTSQRATNAAREQTIQRYSADAGVEYGLWLIENSTITQTTTTAITINGQAVAITVSVLTP